MSDPSDLNAIYYGPVCSATWENDVGARPATEDAVRCLYDLAAGRSVLELGIGTGRLALPLYQLGLHVEGIDSSPWMVEGLRQKPGGPEIPVAIGDLTTIRLSTTFGLVFLASMTMFGLSTQDEQVLCFENAAAHLEPGGLFVVEVSSTHGIWAENGRCYLAGATGRFGPGGHDNGSLLLKRFQPEVQETRGCYVTIEHEQLPRLRPGGGRYACPGELDLMARLAGMRQIYRWSGWTRRRFREELPTYVTVYERPNDLAADPSSR